MITNFQKRTIPLVAIALSILLPGISNASNESAPRAPHNKVTEYKPKYDTSKYMDVSPTEEFETIKELKDIWNIDTGAANVDHKLQEAQIAAKANNFKHAEELFLVALNRDLNSKDRRVGLLQLAEMYNRAGDLIRASQANERFIATFGSWEILRDEAGGSIAHVVKSISVYEKFVATYPDDILIPLINFQLGISYRQIGAYKLALSRFYNVLNTTLNIKPANIPAFKKSTLEAKKQIAETYFQMADYKNSIEFYSRLKLLDLDNAARQQVLFKIAYSSYMLKKYNDAKIQLNTFLDEFPDSRYAPEAHYFLADTFSLLNESQNAVDEVLKLLNNSQVADPIDKEIWFFWQKKCGNKLSNEFYEDGDHSSALTIYQSMWELDTNPEWRVPLMYQMGLCFERVDALNKAQEAYSKIVSKDLWNKKNEKDAIAQYKDYDESKDVKTLQELAKWRMDHIEWNLSAKGRLQRLLNIQEGGS